MAVVTGENYSGAGSKPTNMGLKLGGPTLKQPTFSSGAMDKCTELRNFRLEVNSILYKYSVNNTEKLQVIKTWLGSAGLQFIYTVTKPD